MGIVGIAKRGFGKALKAHKSRQRAKRIAKGERGPDIKSVKPFSGKIPSYVRGTPEERARQVKTHFRVKRIDKVSKAEKQIKEGKKTLKDMEATKQAEEFKDYKGKGTGKYHARQEQIMGDIAQRGNRLTKKDVRKHYEEVKAAFPEDFKRKKPARTRKMGGGRTNLLEQLGRV